MRGNHEWTQMDTNKRGSVLDCGSPLPHCVASPAMEKRQRAAAVQDLADIRSPIPFVFIRVHSWLSFFLAAQINLNHAFVVLHFVHAALAEDVALVEHGDFARELADEGHVVFDDDDGVFAFETVE